MADSTFATDADLLRNIHAGEQTALSELYQRYGNYMYGLSLRIIGEENAAEDAVQDTLLKIWNAAGQWEPTHDAVHWLMKIARNTAIDHLRRKRTAPVQTAYEEEIGQDTSDESASPDRQQDQHAIRESLRNLPTEQRTVIELAFFEGLTHNLIAERLRLPLGTIKTRLRLGLQKLKVLLTDSENELI